jgi:hypothetical protein
MWLHLLVRHAWLLAAASSCLGAGSPNILFNSIFDLSFNMFGVVIGLVGALITSFYQVVIYNFF